MSVRSARPGSGAAATAAVGASAVSLQSAGAVAALRAAARVEAYGGAEALRGDFTAKDRARREQAERRKLGTVAVSYPSMVRHRKRKKDKDKSHTTKKKKGKRHHKSHRKKDKERRRRKLERAAVGGDAGPLSAAHPTTGLQRWDLLREFVASGLATGHGADGGAPPRRAAAHSRARRSTHGGGGGRRRRGTTTRRAGHSGRATSTVSSCEMAMSSESATAATTS